MNELGYVLTPKLSLKNCDSVNPIESIDMVWAGKDYDPYPECDAYFIDVLPIGVYTYNYEKSLDRDNDDTRERRRVWLQLTFNFPKTW